jgi:hypothetical protein
MAKSSARTASWIAVVAAGLHAACAGDPVPEPTRKAVIGCWQDERGGRFDFVQRGADGLGMKPPHDRSFAPVSWDGATGAVRAHYKCSQYGCIVECTPRAGTLECVHSSQFAPGAEVVRSSKTVVMRRCP